MNAFADGQSISFDGAGNASSDWQETNPTICEENVFNDNRPEVVEFVLIDAKRNAVIGVIEDGDKINFEDLPTRLLTIRAKTNPEPTGSVEMRLEGPINSVKTENFSPYTLFGDRDGKSFAGRRFREGKYELTATPFTEANLKGEKGIARTIQFELFKEEPALPKVKEFVLIDAKRNEVIGVIEDGDKINFEDLPTRFLTIRAKTNPEPTGSVEMRLEGPINSVKTENFSPYTLFGDRDGKSFAGRRFREGKYRVTATPYTKSYLGGEKGISEHIDFELIKEQEEERFEVEVDIQGKGQVDLQPNDGPFEAGTLVKLTAEPMPGYRFVKWTNRSGETVSKDNPLFIKVTGDTELQAVFEKEQVLEIQAFKLVDPLSGADVKTLSSGATIELNDNFQVFNIRAEVKGADVESVGFVLEDERGRSIERRTENTAPYALFSNRSNGAFAGRSLDEGTYYLVAAPYTEDGAEGKVGKALTIRFEVVKEKPSRRGGYISSRALPESASSEGFGASVQVYPNPFSGDQLNLKVGQSREAAVTIRLADTNGRILFQQQYDRLSKSQQLTLDLGDIPLQEGAYLLIIEDDEGQLTTKQIIRTRR